VQIGRRCRAARRQSQSVASARHSTRWVRHLYLSLFSLSLSLFSVLITLCSSDDEFIKALRADASGQVLEAFSRADWFRRWGRHYVPSLASSHCGEICGNFKDPGLQSYASALFSELQEAGDEVFCAMAPPKPAPPPPEVIRAMGASYVPPSRPTVSMRRYHNAAGPCVDATARVLLADGRRKPIGALRRGELVLVPATLERAASAAPVECVVATTFDAAARVELCQIGELRVTPWHPVSCGDDTRWHHPQTLAPVKRLACPAGVVSLLLGPTLDAQQTRGACVDVEGVRVAALAHRCQDAVLAHAFFGTESVVANLRELRGYECGRVELHGDCVERDERGLVARLVQH
jgi:hypothetical protein